MPEETSQTTFKITDAPIDDAQVEGVFVTLADVRVDGQSLEGFSKTTIELSALVEGQTLTLGELDLAADSYSSLELVLDTQTDAAGNTPANYIALANGTKEELEASAETIRVTDGFEVIAGAANEIVIDFDLRKTITKSQGALEADYAFASTSQLEAGIRVVNEQATGEIEGTVTDSQDYAETIIVYAYPEGTFNAEAETQGEVQFANAVTSSKVSGLDNSYSLNFLEEGTYELVFASYEETEGSVNFATLLEVESTTGLNLGALTLSAALQLSANVTVTGTL
ncbi:putative lipoprotein [Robiginitalea biformata HTCC2501]|uniref:Putative lipoprotein n=2 Tax=Robiginitalea TaxID=252306 RepID=A4CGU4_ROBBH|nr:putative lipoprotein [Robiginitalea biformata HTCC2501]